jgi:hypothetical protein
MVPVDGQLYKKMQNRIYKKTPTHGAYRSSHVVRAYKRAFRKKHGSRRSPYKGKKRKNAGLTRWFREKWRNQRGEVGYRYKHDVYRPTRRINRRTPKTFRQLSKKDLARAQRTKRKKKRVKRF